MVFFFIILQVGGVFGVFSLCSIVGVNTDGYSISDDEPFILLWLESCDS